MLIIYPNWLPSNAVGVQRIRLIVNYLAAFGWQPIILAVDPAYYEEETADELMQLVTPGIKVFYVQAKHAGKTLRVAGDISLRAFWPLRSKALQIISEEKPDFIWSPVPPFYTALITRLVHNKTGVPYGIDYIDPWVHHFPGANKIFSRAWMSKMLANVLEPIAVRKASVITGVSQEYYLPVLQRNPQLKKTVVAAAMPYGFDIADYKLVQENKPLPWQNKKVKPIIYAGAFLPKAHYFIDVLFAAVAALKQQSNVDFDYHFYFFGTGTSSVNDVAFYAIKNGIQELVTEQKERVSYIDVLHYLKNADAVLAIGSTEKHYTASKIFQAILSGKPVFAVFHEESSAVDVLKKANASGHTILFSAAGSEQQFKADMTAALRKFLFSPRIWQPDLDALDAFSARASAAALAAAVDKALQL